ncbi:unnamed protein product [Anisakis simplex]|uniref:FERM domain-containing protein n=1 Tax=Anisakis simplex TaxID=6269 RepID=A0A0M3J1A7_ANISI|nr:unnamed protein product [Anisakis simplex]
MEDSLVVAFRNETSNPSRKNSSGSLSRKSSGNGMSVGSWSETSAARLSQFCEEDADSRDSGICMDMSPDEMDFTSVRTHSYSRKVSEATTYFILGIFIKTMLYRDIRISDPTELEQDTLSQDLQDGKLVCQVNYLANIRPIRRILAW